jgi:hypothetical protein
MNKTSVGHARIPSWSSVRSYRPAAYGTAQLYMVRLGVYQKSRVKTKHFFWFLWDRCVAAIMQLSLCLPMIAFVLVQPTGTGVSRSSSIVSDETHD